MITILATTVAVLATLAAGVAPLLEGRGNIEPRDRG